MDGNFAIDIVWRDREVPKYVVFINFNLKNLDVVGYTEF